MKVALLVLVLGVVGLGAAAWWEPGATAMNCGGNSAALSTVRVIAVMAVCGAQDAPDHTFRFDSARPQEREQYAQLSKSDWLRGARFLVSTAPVRWPDSAPRHLVVVCDKPYRNVPQVRWGSAPPTHAAGYSDGQTGLISTEEFAKLDRMNLVPLDALVPARVP